MYFFSHLCLSSPKHKKHKWTDKTRSKSTIEKKKLCNVLELQACIYPCHYLNKKLTAKYTQNKITFSVLKSLFSNSTSSTHTLFLSIYIHITRPTPHAFSPALSVTLFIAFVSEMFKPNRCLWVLGCILIDLWVCTLMVWVWVC